MSAEENLFDVTLVIILGGENFLFTLTAARKIEFFWQSLSLILELFVVNNTISTFVYQWILWVIPETIN